MYICWHECRRFEEDFQTGGIVIGGSGFDLTLHAITFALDENRFSMVKKPVQYGRGKSRIVVEDTRPVLVGSVRSDHHGPLFVAQTDDLEEQIGAAFVDRKKAEFVQTKQRR